MTFKITKLGIPEQCGEKCLIVVQSDGLIDKDTADQFIAFAKNELVGRKFSGIVFIESPGGVLEGAIKLGFVFRSLKLTVVVAKVGRTSEGTVTPAQCYSACVYAVMGGKKRVIPVQSKIGVHAIFTNKFEFDPLRAEQPFRKQPAPANVNDVARKYAKYMGISTEVVNLAESVSPNTISILTPAQIRQFRLGVPGLK